MINVYSILRLITFGLLISITSFIVDKSCGGLRDAGDNVPFRPPRWVFPVAWSLLFVTTGLAWYLAKNTIFKKNHQLIIDVILIIITLLSCLWLVIYQCIDKQAACFILLATTLIVWTSVIIFKNTSRWLMIPLGLWTSFATLLNFYEVYKK